MLGLAVELAAIVVVVVVGVEAPRAAIEGEPKREDPIPRILLTIILGESF